MLVDIKLQPVMLDGLLLQTFLVMTSDLQRVLAQLPQLREQTPLF